MTLRPVVIDEAGTVSAVTTSLTVPTRVPAGTTYVIGADSGVVMGWTPKVEAGATIRIGENGVLKVGAT